MSGRVCCCSNPTCATSGCILEKEDYSRYHTKVDDRPGTGNPGDFPDFPGLPLKRPLREAQEPLSEEDIRRVVREEIRNAFRSWFTTKTSTGPR